VNRTAYQAGILLAEVSHRNTDLESRYLELIGAADPAAHPAGRRTTPSTPPAPRHGAVTEGAQR
ncbi:MAG: hypothetical protein M3519_01025, partial [Actinomycetota bacterium]|nr:hypothetical protein [Actinomycetota bacterium]